MKKYFVLVIKYRCLVSSKGYVMCGGMGTYELANKCIFLVTTPLGQWLTEYWSKKQLGQLGSDAFKYLWMKKVIWKLNHLCLDHRQRCQRLILCNSRNFATVQKLKLKRVKSWKKIFRSPTFCPKMIFNWRDDKNKLLKLVFRISRNYFRLFFGNLRRGSF